VKTEPKRQTRSKGSGTRSEEGRTGDRRKGKDIRGGCIVNDPTADWKEGKKKWDEKRGPWPKACTTAATTGLGKLTKILRGGREMKATFHAHNVLGLRGAAALGLGGPPVERPFRVVRGREKSGLKVVT